MILGQDRSIEQFVAAWARRKLHHAWLLAGPQGVGKATFANAAARRVLAVAAGPSVDLPGLETPDDHPIVKLVEAGSHPDMRWLKRLPKEKGDGLARDITIKQVRALGEFMGMTAALSPWRVAVIDSMDELNKEASNALLKMLEEPPPNTLFFLVSHAPGRLLPTIRSRCRLLQFDPLDDDAMTSILEARSPELSAARSQADGRHVAWARWVERWPLPSSTSRRWRKRRSQSSARVIRRMRVGRSLQASSARRHRRNATPHSSSSYRHSSRAKLGS